MKVLFLKSIKGVAQVGDIKDMSDGYARNFLIPRKFAKAATATIEKEAEVLKSHRAATDTKNKAAAEELAKRLEGASIEITEEANAEGHLYGSVDQKKIVHALEKSLHIQLTEDQVELPHHIKTVGEHHVKLNLFAPRGDAGQTIATTLTVRVLPS